ncbi:ATP-dependent helicase HepA [compost metagenome]
MNQRLYGIWLGEVLFCFSGEVSESKVDAWTAAIRPLRLSFGGRPFQHAALRLAELRYPVTSIRRAIKPGERRSLIGRTLEGLALPVQEAWPMLLNYDEAEFINQGVQPGAEFEYWSTAARFALDLMLRGKIIPGTKEVPGGPGRRRGQASLDCVWKPFLEEAVDMETFRQLAASMPPICLAAIQAGSSGEEGSIAGRQMAQLHSFLTAMINGETRKAVNDLGRKLNPTRADYRRGTSPLAELWWNGMLTGGKPPEIQGSTAEMEELAGVISSAFGDYPRDDEDEIRARKEVLGTIRLCLRIEPTQERHERIQEEVQGPIWRLSFWCEGAEDPSMLLPAEMIWSYPKRDIIVRGRRYKDVQENLLLRISKAAALSEEVDSALETERPIGKALRSEELYTFLSKSVSPLRKHGITVQMPSSWTKEGKRSTGIKLKVSGWRAAQGRAKVADSQRLGVEQLIDYKAEAMLGDKELTLEELAELASSKSPLVLFRGEWIEIDVKEIRQVLKYMKRQENGTMTFRELMHLTSNEGYDARLDGMHVEGVEIEGRLSMLAEGNGGASRYAVVHPVPGSLHGILRPYQERGFQWLSSMKELGFGSLLADDMGLGKTVQVITTLLDGLEQKDNPSLIICPTSLLGNWQRELARFAPEMRVYVHHGSGRLHGDHFLQNCLHCDVVLTTYQLVGRDTVELRSLEWSTIVLDEAQYIKNFGTKQTQSVMKLSAPHRIAMTGTPVENRLSELWSIFQFLNPGYLGSYSAFRSRYTGTGEQQSAELDKLRKLVSPLLLRRLKSDPDIRKDLPEKIELKSYCPMTVEQIRMYEAITEDLLSRISGSDGMARKGLVLSSLTKLKQVCDHPQLAGGRVRLQNRAERSGKLERLSELLDLIVDNGEAALIFTQYVQMGELLQEFLSERYGQKPFFLHGGTSKQERDDMVHAFQEGNGSPLFVLSLKAGGVGLNLTRANHVIHYDRWWNPAVENQATDRVFRIGQQKNVEVHKLICQGTLEERIDELIEKKKSLSEQVVGSGEQWLTEMSNDELRSLVTLHQGSFLEGDIG